jgi:hypothetical protein
MSQLQTWQGEPLGAGLVSLQPGAPGDAGALIVGRFGDDALLTVPGSQVGCFLDQHPEAEFVCADLPQLQDGLCRGCTPAAITPVWHAAYGSRLLDLRRLDRLLRACHGADQLGLRALTELGHFETRKARPSTAGAALASALDTHRQIVAAFERLRAAHAALAADVRTPREPAYRLGTPGSGAAAPLGVLGDGGTGPQPARADGGADLPGATPGTASPASPPPAPGWPTLFASGRTEGMAGLLEGYLGAVGDGRGLGVDPAARGRLAAAAEGQFRRAAAVLLKDRGAAEAFGGSPDKAATLPRNKNGHLEPASGWGRWLREAAGELFDRFRRPAVLPRAADGTPSLNPEKWGIWPACHPALFAWRQAYRAAELARLAARAGGVTPGYETLPGLRSREPNLVAYRGARLPIFVPRPGHVFLAGRIELLTLRCLAAVGLQQGWSSSPATRRLPGILARPQPLRQLAEDLYAAHRASPPPRAGRAPARPPAEDRARERFGRMRADEPRRYRSWLRVTRVLLESFALGLGDATLVSFLRLEYGWGWATEPRIARLLDFLAGRVAPELQFFWADQTADLLAARLDRPAADLAREQASLRHPATRGAELRNRLLGRRGRAPRLPVGPAAPAQPGGRRAALIEYRAWTPGARPTVRAGQAAVTHHLVRWAADEVRLEVAFALACTAGYRLLAVAGDEFLVEVPDGEQARARRLVAAFATGATSFILGDELQAPVRVTACDRW